MDSDAKETKPLLEEEASTRGPTSRALKVGVGATVLALCFAAVAATTPLSFAAGEATSFLDASGNQSAANESGAAGGSSLPKFMKVLNTQMRQSKNFKSNVKKNIYQDGDNIGVMVRNIDDGQTFWFSDFNQPTSPNCGNQNCQAVGTFWHNDLQGISQMYPPGDPWCPQNVDSGHGLCANKDDWDKPVVGIVVGSMFTYLLEKSGMPSKDHGSAGVAEYLQDDHWGYGVLYAHDSNAADSRCIFVDLGNNAYMYDCPGYYIPSDANGNRGASVKDSSKLGSGGYPPGNKATSWGSGGGSGCHWGGWMNPPDIDQVGMTDGTKGRDSLVQDPNCQCHYLFNDNWYHWIQFAEKYWSECSYNPGYKPTWYMDKTACWMNNIKDMIRLQNWLYWEREEYLDGSIPWTSWDFVKEGWKARQYWGWNEVPANAQVINDPGTWDALLITLPAFTCQPSGGKYKQDYLACLSDDAKKSLDAQLEKYENEGALKPGENMAASRPGSSVAIARQNPDNFHQSKMTSTIGWTREFYCEDYETYKYKIVWKKEKDENKAGCYIVKK